MIINHLQVFLPIALVIIAFILKLFMDRSATAPLMIRSVYELPVDIIFLTLSFMVAFTLTSKDNVNQGLAHLFIFLIAVIISVILWRRSIKYFEEEKKKLSASIFIVNFIISTFCLIQSIQLLIGEKNV